jgi:PAS domain S-box-containing protein
MTASSPGVFAGGASRALAAAGPSPDFRALFESAPGLYLVLSPELRIVAASDAYLRATMTSREGILGQHLFDAFPDNPDDPAADGVAKLKASLDVVLSARVPHTMAVQKYDIRRPAEDGGGFEVRYWSPMNSPVFGADGQISYIIHRVEDVTDFVRLEQRGAEHDLRAEKFRQRVEAERDQFFALSLDMLCVANRDGYFKRLNPAFTDTLGWSLEELLARPFIEFVHPDDRAATLREVERQVVAGQPVLSFENRYRCKDGSWRVLSWKSVPQPGGNMIATARDVTRERLAQQELESARASAESANRAKSVFLANMSHELRTPLNAVIGFTGTLLMRLPGPLTDDQEAQLRTVQGSARHLLSLINDLLDLAKIESGKITVLRERVDVRKLLEDIRTSLMPLAAAKGLQFTLEAREPVEIVTDLRALKQIVINLANNAIKFTDRGAVTLTLERHPDAADGAVLIAVTDTGVGIRPEDRGRMFQAFAQMETTDREGSGLGLHLSQKLAHLIGGRIQFHSEYGAGSRFWLTLPGE